MNVKKIFFPCLALVLLVVFGGSLEAKQNDSIPQNIAVYEQKNLKSHGYFFVGGEYIGLPGKEVMAGQMYVETLVPKKVTKPYPLVLFHGAGQTAPNWMNTPDGREGWADYFIEQGYIVYLVDQPARGRSAYHPEDGKLKCFSAPVIEKLFTATESLGDWSLAKKHTQWPGEGSDKGHKGNAVFDSFYATQVEFLASNADTQRLVQKAGVALLDQIGPAILLTHSQAGAFGWLLADIRPDKVKGILALEPLGPPFQDAVLGNGKAREWGVTDIPITYDPPVKDASELVKKRVEADRTDLVPGWLQEEPARQLPNLKGIPILIVSTESSYHAPYDQWTAKYLEQAGVKNTYIRLEDIGIRGNGHMMMLEKNNLEIAAFLNKWMIKNIK